QLGLSLDQVPVLVGTLGKGFGTAGAFVARSEALIETLIQHARSYIYTTAMPPAVAAATLASLRLIQQGQHLRQHLSQLINQFRQGAEQLGLQLMDSPTPIQPILIGDSGQALAMSAALEQRGIFVTAIRPPTVPEGSARLRVTLSAAHTSEQVDRLLQALAEVVADGLGEDAQ
ncbi:MAG: aminotransferase class I/II-fold pyridoxal phosphate-dependent enzyme, partial [Halopseudomonas sp.]